MLRNIQREQQVHHSTKLAKVEDQPPAQEVKWSYGKELTPDQSALQHKRLTVQVVAEMGDNPHYRQSLPLITGIITLFVVDAAASVRDDVLVSVIVPL